MKLELDEQSLSLMLGYEQAESVPETPQTPTSKRKKGLNLRPLWRLIRRNIFLIGSVNLLVTGLTLYLVLSRPLTYEGEFQLLVEPLTATDKLTDPSFLSRGGDLSDDKGLDYATLIRVLKSPTVLEDILKQMNLKHSITYNELLQSMMVERIVQDEFNKTKLIRVSYQATDQDKILDILGDLASGYLQYSLEERKRRIGGGVAFIEKQLPELKQRVTKLEGQLQTLQQQERISDLTSEGAELAKQARKLETKQSETQQNLQAKRKLYANLQKQVGLGPAQVIPAASLSEDPNYQDLLKQLKQVETQLAQERARFTDANPVVQELLDKQRNLRALVNQETRKLFRQDQETRANALPQFQNSIQRALSQKLIDTLNDIQVLEVENQAATQAAAAIDVQLRRFPAVRRKYQQLNRELEIDNKTLRELLLKRETLKVEAAQQEIPWQIPTKPQMRTDDLGNLVLPEQSRTKKIALGVLGGFLLGLGAALLREKQRDVFSSVEDLQDQAKLPLLGSLPFNHAIESIDQERDSEVDELSVVNHQNQTFLQAAEALYTKIRFLAIEPPIRSLVIGSIAPRDGKTTVALYLAQSAARMGQRVLLVDANMSFPQLHSRLGLPNFKGLSNVLDHNLDPNELIQRVPYQKNLSLLTAGQMIARGNRSSASNQMKYLMDQLHNMFDLVLYDTPAMQEHTDAKFLSLNTDGLVMVVGVGKTRQSALLETLNDMQAERLPILGLVSNFASAGTDSASAHGYFEEGEFEDYFKEDVEVSEGELDIFRSNSRQKIEGASPEVDGAPQETEISDIAVHER